MITNRDKAGRIKTSTGVVAKFTVNNLAAAQKVRWSCHRCNKRKRAVDFYLRATRYGNKLRRSTVWCKVCHSAHAVITWRQKSTRRMYWINKYKIAKGCSQCGYNKHAVAIDFHHVGQKDYDLNKIKTHSLIKLFSELRRCILLCANCHRVEHLTGKLTCE